MTTLQKAEELISAMAPAEKAQVLQWLARDFSGALPGIESNPEVAGGEPCIVRTRIPRMGSGTGKEARCKRSRLTQDVSNFACRGSGQRLGVLSLAP